MKPTLKFIGKINTPYKAIEDCPNNIDSDGPLCQVVVDDEYKDGLSGLTPGQKILILYWFDGVNRGINQQKSRDCGKVMGTFALRSPHRPNPIGAAVLSIKKINDGEVVIKGLDCLDGTPLLDIKPAI